MMDFGGIGWRDLVLVAAAMVGVYLVLLMARLFQVAAKRRPAVPSEPTFGDDDEALDQDVPLGERSAPAQSFARELNRSGLEGELNRLRREGDQLRELVANLSEEVSRLKSARNVSPLYNEAMSLAQQGMPPEGIAGHCGITLGEAELVAALAKSEDEFDRENLDEDRDDRYPKPGNRRAVG